MSPLRKTRPTVADNDGPEGAQPARDRPVVPVTPTATAVGERPSADPSPDSPSAALQAANQRLLALRAQHAERQGRPPWEVVPREAPPGANGQPRAREVALPIEQPPASTMLPPLRREPRDLAEAIAALPDHLGWHSEAVTRALRAAATRQARRRNQQDACWPGTQAGEPAGLSPHVPTHSPMAPELTDPDTATTGLPEVIKIRPDLAAGLLRAKETATGRFWLLLRFLDQPGRGWLTHEEVRAALTDLDSPYRLCSPRHLRNLLSAGDGLFWTRDDKRLWLWSEAKLLAALDAPRVSNRPVLLPGHLLLGKLGVFRAALYAAIHSARDETPIARESLRDLTGASPRTQQGYEKKAKVRARGNIALGAPVGHVDPQEVAWRRGRAGFKLRDGAGAYGPAGQCFHAWRLPNSYQGPFPALGRQRRRRGRKHQRSQGNQRTDQNLRRQGDAGNRQRRYAAGARALARLLRSKPGDSFYWHLPDRPGVWCHFGKEC